MSRHYSSHSGRSHYNEQPRRRYDDDEDDVDDEAALAAILGRTKQVRDDSLNLTREMVGRMKETESSGARTLEKLASQSENLHRAEKELDAAKLHAKVADAQVGEVKRLNKWFALRNPFNRKTSKKAIQKLEDEQLRLNETRKNDQEASRAAQEASRQRVDEAMRAAGSRPSRSHQSSSRHHHSSRSAYNDLMDDEDRDKEAEIDANLDEIGDIAANLRRMAAGMSAEVDSQTEHIGRLDKKAQEMNVKLGMTQNRMKKIR